MALRHRRTPVFALLLSALAVSTGTALHTSAAGFTANTGNPANSWATGSVALTDDDTGSALFSTGAPKNDGNLNGGQNLTTRCITTTYTGDWTAASFSDDFTSQDARWAGWGAQVSATGGALSIIPAGYPSPALVSAGTVNFYDTALTMHITQVPTMTAGTVDMVVRSAGGKIGYLRYEADRQLLIAQGDAGGSGFSNAVAWNAAAMAYLRIKSTAGLWSFDYSADGVTWTTFQTQTVGAYSGATIFVEGSTSQGSPGVFKASNISLTPNAGVHLYGTASGALAPYLNLTIERGTGGSFGSCSGFTPEATVYTGTPSGFASTATDYAHGVGAWSAATSPASKTYRFTMGVAADNNAMNKTATGTFTWEAQTG